MMHMHFKTKIKDVSTTGYGVKEHEIHGDHTGLTNVIVYWKMSYKTKGDAGFDIVITIECVSGDHIFETLKDGADFYTEELIPFEVRQFNVTGHMKFGESTTHLHLKKPKEHEADFEFNERIYQNDDKEIPQGEFYAQSVEIDFERKIVDVYFD